MELTTNLWSPFEEGRIETIYPGLGCHGGTDGGGRYKSCTWARVVRNLGVVRGITVCSRSVLGIMVGGLQTIFGGDISIYAELCEHARQKDSEGKQQLMAPKVAQ